MRRRDPSPFGSRHERSSGWENQYLWSNPYDQDARTRHSRRADLFERLKAQRVIRIRLAVEIALLVCGIYLVSGLPPWIPLLGGLLAMIGMWGAIWDLVMLARLRRSIAEAWQDLPTPDA